MTLNPMTVYDKAVKAVPSLKWAMAVAGVVAAGAIALMVANEDPRRAFFLFLVVAAGMLLMMIISGDFPGPRAVLVWTITVCFVVCLIFTITAYAIGCPANWAELVGARPNCPWFRVWNDGFTRTATDTAQNFSFRFHGFSITESFAEPLWAIATTSVFNALGTSSAASCQVREPSHTWEHVDEVRVAQQGATAFTIAQSQPNFVERSFVLRESSNDCGVRNTIPREFCLDPGVRVNPDRTKIAVNSANCGSAIGTSRQSPDKPNCLIIDVRLQGCGYDNFLGLKNCRGRGWLNAIVTVSGDR